MKYLVRSRRLRGRLDGCRPAAVLASTQHVDADTNQRVIDGITAQARCHEDAGNFRETSTKPDIVRPLHQTAQPVCARLPPRRPPPQSAAASTAGGRNRRPQDERGEDRASRRGLPGSPAAAASGGLLRTDDDSALPRAEPGELARDLHGARHAVVVDQPAGIVSHASGVASRLHAMPGLEIRGTSPAIRVKRSRRNRLPSTSSTSARIPCASKWSPSWACGRGASGQIRRPYRRDRPPR